VRHAGARQSLHGQHARREHQRQHRHFAAGRQLSRRPRAVGGENEGKSETISSPRVITANQKQADDPAGYRDPLPGIGLERRDHHPVQERGAVAQGDAADHAGQPRDPGSRRERRHGRSAGHERHRRLRALDRYAPDQTQVLVGDGQTVVLGGILETTKSYSANKVPWLGDIPILGNLFKSTTNINNKTELLIFITPKILREGSNLY
jgi:hypothetical protein